MHTDEDLIAAYRAGDDSMTLNDLFQQLFLRHKSRVFNWCYRFAGNREGAADLMQEVFLKAFRNLHNFRGDSKFSTWMYVIARNHCLNAAAKPAATAVMLDGELAATLADPSAPDTLHDLERKQERQMIWRTIRNVLNRTEAQVMMLHYGEEVPLAGVTQKLGLTNPSGAKAVIVSARRKIDAALRRQPQPRPRVLAAA